MPPQVQVQEEEINRLTNVVAQRSAGDQQRVENNYNAPRHRYTCNHSTPNMSPVVPDYYDHIHYDNQGCQGNHFEWQVPEQRRCPQAPYNNTKVDNHPNVNSPNFLHVLGNFSSKQTITQTTLNCIPEYDGSNKAATILWLDHIEMVAENTGINPLEVGISILKGLALGDITAICKEGHLMWYNFRQWLIEHYSNVPYMSDAMYTYSHLSQDDEEPTRQYLSRDKVLLECIHHKTKLSSIPGVG